MNRFLSRIAMRSAGWLAERAFDLACVLDAMDDPPPGASPAVVPMPQHPVRKPRRRVADQCPNCGVVPRFGVCGCGLAPGLAQRMVAGGVC